ncbi:MAG: hypothetical protein KBC81_02110 [Candidatus Pacebacteria bacterium]|nr:hypothetical protein [Candidatus Paceibacterota bacterium]
MFRNIQDRFSRRLETIKTKNQVQSGLDKVIRSFLIQEFGPIGESLSFKASQENKKVSIRMDSKIAANEIVIRSGKLKKLLQEYDFKIEGLNVD